ncbi:uncharacterized protein SEPMUDRAFT_145842 [Sphaerulina musiva SO2202]|uniref:Uncharacterized protein n=1 Tax=Sphaerulina musiva (strain SO2202) TaxID=692275 RepID=N1QHD4_SPHMS|nr:uncharacterized protein SEPMUDRAFT_145842 [Sphaerulina musiva SO2202]EMF16636.1 hypothetical protein SEPMUDRAFT_145842 [Sphaerulina musiva SO2202]
MDLTPLNNNRDDRKKEVQAAAVPDVPFQRFSSDHSQVLSTALEKTYSHTASKHAPLLGFLVRPRHAHNC